MVSSEDLFKFLVFFDMFVFVFVVLVFTPTTEIPVIFGFIDHAHRCKAQLVFVVVFVIVYGNDRYVLVYLLRRFP